MSIEIRSKVTRNGQKIWYTFEWGKGPSERKAAGIFTYTKPKDQIQKNHNKEALALLNTKKSQMVIDQQSIGTPFIPTHRFKENFLDYYAGFVEENKRPGNRHLQGSLNQFKLFIKKPRILPMEITENLSKRFRTFLTDKFTGKTPADYFRSFKHVVRSAMVPLKLMCSIKCARPRWSSSSSTDPALFTRYMVTLIEQRG
jgi:hypothetical protein